MTQAAAQEQNVEQPVSLAALFTAFLIVSVCGIGGGGGIVWARRIAVEKRRWIAHLTVLRNILDGIAAAAAGLLIATGIRLLMPHHRRSAALLFAALAFSLILFGNLPLLVVLFGLVPLAYSRHNTPSEKPTTHGMTRKPQSAAIVPIPPRIFAPTQTAMPTMFGPGMN
jgi:chromate transport protein ChrA